LVDKGDFKAQHHDFSEKRRKRPWHERKVGVSKVTGVVWGMWVPITYFVEGRPRRSLDLDAGGK